MITNKDIRVENGSLIINGDPYPLDGQSPETIMEIVEDNSDSTPTENSTAPVTSGGVFTADKAISDTIGDITQTGVTGASVAAQINTLDTNKLKVGIITSASVSINSGEHQFVDIPLNNPLPETTIAAFCIETASAAWVFANYYDRETTVLRVGVYNTHPTEAITGTYKVAYIYT